MSPPQKNRRIRHLTPLFVLIVVFALSLQPISAQDNQENIPGPSVLAQLNDIQTIVADLRGLAILEPVDVYFMGPEERDALYSGESPGIAMRSFYAAFDLIPLETDLARISRLLDAQTESGGYYIHGTNEVTIMLYTEPTLGVSLPLRERITYAHELTHALQDQHFNLGRLANTYFNGNGDQRMGVLGLVEGDAMLTEQMYADVLSEFDPRAKEVMSFDILGFGEYTDAIPDIYREATYHTYLDGMNFVKYLYNEGGWELVNAAYDDPPRSSENILHPETYLAGDTPLEVTIEPVSAAWDADWDLMWGDTFGEFYLRQYLYTRLGADTANQAAAGWGGDRYLLYHNYATGQQAYVMRHLWDSATDADEFRAAYAQLASARLDAFAFALDETTTCWKAAIGEVMCLRTESANGTLTLFAPDLGTAQALLAES